MSILHLLNRVCAGTIDPCHPITVLDPQIKRSYLTGIALQAYADHVLDEQEKSYFLEMADALDVHRHVADRILSLASRPNQDLIEEVRRHLLHTKEKYYFIIDLRLMSHQDQKIVPIENEVICEFCRILQIDKEDKAFLIDLADAVVTKDPQRKERWLEAFFQNVHLSSISSPADFAHYTSEDNFID